MRVTYIYHSCFLLEHDDFSIIFDYYNDIEKEEGKYWIKDYLLSKKGFLYVFCTHSHSDHFNPEIFEWKSKKKDIKYIFSHEVYESQDLPVNHEIIFLDKLESYEDERIKVMAFGSTDLGGSFLVEIDGKQIFHAGDLNNWHWNEEVSKIEAAGYENNYLCELELLAEMVVGLYLAMFPIDPRLGKDYMKGAEQFVKRISVDYLLPMHFGDNFDKANAFEHIAKLQSCKYLRVTKKGESFNL